MDEEIQIALNKKFEEHEKALNKMIEEGATKVEVEAVLTSMKEISEGVEALQEKIKDKQIKSVLEQFESFLFDNVDKLKEFKNNKHGIIEFVPKVVGAMSTASGTNVGVEPNNMHTNLGHFNLRNDNELLNMCTISDTGSPNLSYTELEPKDGNYASVAEAGVKPQIDFLWKTRFAEPKKTAAYEVLSEEAATDIKRLVSVAKEYLKKKHDLFKVNDVFFGTGIGTELEGATTVGRTFSAGPMALAVKTPNFMDVVNAAIVDIYTTQNFADEAPYEANLVLISPVDFYVNITSAKDANGLPLYPAASIFNRVKIGGVTIKPWIKIPVGSIFVGDMKKYNIINYIPFSIRVGWINNQFITNQFTILGESRYFGYVKNLDRQAFLYDSIATIKTAITFI